MFISKYGLLAFALIMVLTVSIFGSYAGYTVDGVPHGGATLEAQTGLFSLADWAWDSMGFMFSMVTFQIDNVPVFIAGIFLVINLMMVFLVITTIRGN